MAQSVEPASKETHDLTENGALVKTILVEGEGEEAGRGAKVSVRYALRLEEGEGCEPFDSSVKRKEGLLEFTLGKKKVIPALEIVAQSMKQGEKCSARSEAPYAFGARGLKRKGVLPNTPIYLEVEMVRFEGGETMKPIADMSPAEVFEQAKACKENGNNFFKEQKFDKALVQYSQGIRYLSNVFYKPSSGLPRQDGKEVAKSAVKDTTPSADEQKIEEKEEGFVEAEVVDTQEQSSGNVVVKQNAEAGLESSDVSEALPNVSNSGEGTEGGGDINEPRHVLNDGQDSGADEEEEDDPIVTIDATKTIVQTIVGEGTSDSLVGENGVQDSGADSADAYGEQDEKPSTGVAEDAQGSDDPGEAEVRALHVTTLNNLSLCFVKLENYKRAVESASFALKMDPTSSKALYYRYVCLATDPIQQRKHSWQRLPIADITNLYMPSFFPLVFSHFPPKIVVVRKLRSVIGILHV